MNSTQSLYIEIIKNIVRYKRKFSLFSAAILSSCMTLLLFFSSLTVAEEITLNHNGLRINADYEKPAHVKTPDHVMLIVHGGLAHKNMENLQYLRSLLAEAGMATLSINLSLSLDNRHGMYDCKVPHQHTNDDAVHEIGVWTQWLVAQGVKNITLLGHSRGGAQVALYAAENSVPAVKNLILMAPATRDNGAPTYEARFKQPLAPTLQKAKQLVESGNPDSLLDHANIMFCRDTQVSAKSVMSYFNEIDRLDTPYLLGKINKPTLVIVASHDEVVVELDKKIKPLLTQNHIAMKIIDGAGHMFRDLNMDDATEAMFAFLGQQQAAE